MGFPLFLRAGSAQRGLQGLAFQVPFPHCKCDKQIVSESYLLSFLLRLSMSRCCLHHGWRAVPCSSLAHFSQLPLPWQPHAVVILGLGTSAHKQQASAFTHPKLPIKFFNACRLWKSSQVVFMKKYLSGFSYMCHQPAELSFSFEGEGFPTLRCELLLLAMVLWSGQDGLGRDGSVLDF